MDASPLPLGTTTTTTIKSSIVVAVPNERQALFKIVSAFALRNVMIVKIKSRLAATAVRLFSPDDTLELYFLYRQHDEPRFDAGRKRNCVRLWKICSVGSRSGHVHEQQRQNVRRTSTLDMRVKDKCLLSLALTTRAADVDSPSKRYVNVTLWEVDALSR